ncbi:MAG: hypothetical protein A2X36_01445 [Elusimicrobia bacterium GWA2_69_24]|nr:MAG: hypothetical protein A2X36_01445 [Elusimicrobia bacterium GWA2_69_24]
MKVVHVVTRLDFGGAQQNTLYTVGHVDRARFEPVLVCGEGGRLDPEARALEARGTRVVFLPDLVRELHPLRDFIALLQLHRLLVAERPDAVHTHSSKAGILGRLAAWLAGVPVIVHTFHGFGFHDRMAAPVRGAIVLVERLAAALSSWLIFVSQDNMRTAAACGIGSPRRQSLIRSGVALARFPAPVPDRAAKRASLALPGAGPWVLSVGNLKAQKNAMDFARLAGRLAPKHPAASFLFVGDGPLRPALEAAIAEAGLQERAHLLGWRDDVPELLAVADVFVLTSLWEGLPRALVEAMRSGLPCACYAVDGVRDLISDGRNGFAAPPGDWEGLADRVARLLEDPALRRRLGAAGTADIGIEFDIDHMVHQQEDLLLKLLSRA